MPQSKRAPRLGLYEVFKDRKRFANNRTAVLMDATLKYGDVVELPHPFEKLYVASHPLAIRHILLENANSYTKSSEYEILKRWAGNSLFLSEGDLWQNDRKMLQPEFRHEAIARFESQIEESITTLLDSWADKSQVDVGAEMTWLALDIIVKRLFGHELRQHLEELADLMTQCQEHVTQSMLGIDWGRYLPTRAEKIFKQNIRRLSALIGDSLDHPEPGSVAQLLLDYRHPKREGPLSHKERVDHALGMLMAGHETSAQGLMWALYLLAENPRAQRKIRANSDYAAQVFEETLRLYPPIPCYARMALEDDQVMGFKIPKGATVVLPQYVTHRRPDLWKNPDLFDPDRFGPDRRGEIIKYSYFPFGAGPRFCIGQGLAMLEAEMTLSKVTSRFELLPDLSLVGPGNQPQPNVQLTLRADRPVLLQLKEIRSLSTGLRPHPTAESPAAQTSRR